MRVEETDLPLGDELLEFLVRQHRQIHVVRIGTDEHELVRKDEIDRLRQLGGLLGIRQRGLPGSGTFGIQLVNPHHALHGMHATTGHKTRGTEKESSDATFQLTRRILCKNRITKNFHA